MKALRLAPVFAVLMTSQIVVAQVSESAPLQCEAAVLAHNGSVLGSKMLPLDGIMFGEPRAEETITFKHKLEGGGTEERTYKIILAERPVDDGSPNQLVAAVSLVPKESRIVEKLAQKLEGRAMLKKSKVTVQESRIGADGQMALSVQDPENSEKIRIECSGGTKRNLESIAKDLKAKDQALAAELAESLKKQYEKASPAKQQGIRSALKILNTDEKGNFQSPSQGKQAQTQSSSAR